LQPKRRPDTWSGITSRPGLPGCAIAGWSGPIGGPHVWWQGECFAPGNGTVRVERSAARVFRYRTDSEQGEVIAEDIDAAIDKIRPTEDQIADGAWAWVEDAESGERIYAAEENMP